MRLADICEAVVDCEHKTAPAGDGFAFAVGTKAMKGGRLVLESARPVSEETYGSWTRRMRPVPGDLILAREAPVGDVVRVPESPRICLGQRTVLIRPDESQVLSRFLHYWLLGPDAQGVMRAQTGGATVGHLNVGDIRKLDVGPMPTDPRHQAATANLLGSIDDLIENNRRRVEVLEEMARAIYREWFVDFRYPGQEDVPLVDSALGPIPEGWVVGKVDQLCSRVQAGATPRRSTPEFWAEPSVDWYKTGDLTDGVLLGSSEQLSDAGLEAGRTFDPETILMAIYGSPTVGRLGLLTSKASANQAALGLVADPDACTTEYLWFVLESLRGHLNQIAQGAAQQNVSKEKVIGCDVVIPPREVVKSFTLRAAPCWRLSHELARQAAALESLRDLLLPRLVTGQIDVSTLDLDGLVSAGSTARVGVA